MQAGGAAARVRCIHGALAYVAGSLPAPLTLPPTPQDALVEAFARMPVTGNLLAQVQRGALPDPA